MTPPTANNTNPNDITMTPPIEINPRITSRPIDAGALSYADNPHPRCPVALLLDCSQSMEGEPVAELNTALRQFLNELGEDPVAAMSVEPGVITFGESVHALRPFGPPGDPMRQPPLQAAGRTPMGAALRMALSEIRARRRFYREHGLPAYAPWIVLMTDGQPNDDWRGVAAEALALSKAGRLVLIGVALGEHADMTTLREIVGGDPGPFRLRGLCFRNFFRWLSDSLHTVADTPLEQRLALPNPANYDWIV